MKLLVILSTVFRLKGSDQKMNLSKHILQVKERLVTSSTPFLLFMILSITGEGKEKLTFSWSLLKHLAYGFLKFQVFWTC